MECAGLQWGGSALNAKSRLNDENSILRDEIVQIRYQVGQFSIAANLTNGQRQRLREIASEPIPSNKAQGGEDSGVAPRSTDGADPLHASAPEGCKCADCEIDQEACPTCYAAWWKERHPNTTFIISWPDGFVDAICTLLDRIEVEEDHTLASMRHGIAEEYGMTVVIGEQVSGRMN